MVTAQYDGKPAYIRSETIESVIDNAEQKDGETIRLACRTINYAGRSINVIDEAEDILDKIYNAEL
jgi:hypothetical protein